MSTTQTAATAGAVTAAPAPIPGRYNRSLLGDTWGRFRRHNLAVIGAFVYLSLVVMTLVGPMIWTTPMNDIDFSASNTFSAKHPLGTDDLGRDTLARVLWGGRVSIAVGLCAMARFDDHRRAHRRDGRLLRRLGRYLPQPHHRGLSLGAAVAAACCW